MALPITCLWLLYEKMICSLCNNVFPWFQYLQCVCKCPWGVRACVSMMCCIDINLFNRTPRVRSVHLKVKTPLSQAYDFPPSFLADSGLVFTGCFICLIYVPCPDCCMVPACSSHMAVQHALMRFPISRNTNCVFRPSLWLYDVWTHKSIPETTDLVRSKLDQARSPSVWVCFQSPDSFLSHISKMRLWLWRDWNFFYLLVIQPLYFLAGDFNVKH